MPIEETGGTSVSTDFLNIDVSLCIQIKKTNFNYSLKALGIDFWGISDPLQFKIAQNFLV